MRLFCLIHSCFERFLVFCKVFVSCSKQFLMSHITDYAILRTTYGCGRLGRYLLTGSLECGGARSTERASAVSRLEVFLTRAAQWPWLKILKPFLLKVLAVIKPMKQIRISLSPKISIPVASRVITVMSANLWHDWPLRRRLSDRLEAFAQLVESEGADVVLLQEVMRSARFCADDWLANRLGMAYAYTPANGDENAIGFEEGLAVFSRFPILTPQCKLLGKRSNFFHRLALGAEVKSPFGNLLAISVHLGLLQRRNRTQWSDLQSWVTDMAGGRTALIGGDFNVPEGTDQIRQAQELWIDTFRLINPKQNATTHELRMPWGASFRRRRLDYIFLQPGPTFWTVLEARHLETPDGSHSDHRAVMARLMPKDGS
jgi:endonuclease/exonuclease/phosphatase family metal-dependent hydrolase